MLVVLVACNVLSLIDCLGGGMVAMLGVCVACSKLLAGYHGLPRSYYAYGRWCGLVVIRDAETLLEDG